MRTLLLFRGAPGCGKSTFIEQNGLKPYTLSADDIRLLVSSPVMTRYGNMTFNPDNDMFVWRMLMQMLEKRMENGEFTVIDATNSKTSEMNKYKDLGNTYKYRIYCIDMTSLPIEECKARNMQREPLKRVPEEAIDKMYARFATQKIPTGITVLKPDELNKIWMRPIDLSQYNKIHHIGDTHGCCTVLKEYINGNGGIKDDEFYIFLGDYIDRGIENVEILKYLLEIYKKPNVLLLEGNHERWLWTWANDAIAKSKEFELGTRPQLDASDIDKRDIRQLYRKFAQCAYYTYHGKTVLAAHGGLSRMPENLTMISTRQLIHGAGNYNDCDFIAERFHKTSPEILQIHGHRNTKGMPFRTYDNVVNLEGGVEFGRQLRCVQLLPSGEMKFFALNNHIFKEPEVLAEPEKIANEKSVGDTIMQLRNSRFVAEKQYGNISSFNFTRTAFEDRVWNDLTIRARGLYINIPKQKVVARAYDKFFRVNERPETKMDILQYKLQFPVTAYVKENGFLGLVSYNEETDDLFITTKSSPDGECAMWLKNLLTATLSSAQLDRLRVLTKELDSTFVFECVDMIHDPHIIEYPESKLFLLDIVKNDMRFQKQPYEKIVQCAAELGLTPKEKALVIESWQDFFDWYYKVMDEDYLYNGRHIEGFVVEDAAGYMIKLKLAYYNFWKFMRGISAEVLRRGYVDKKRLSSFTTPLANHYYAWIKTQFTPGGSEGVPRDICSLRKMFLASDEGSLFRTEG